jgi:hypothetical protein
MSVRRTNRFWSVSLEHTLLLDFLKLFLNMRLVVSFAEKKKRIFWTYGSKVMNVWSFKEKSGQGGHVVQPMRKSWPLAQKVEGRKKKKFKKNGNSLTSLGVNPRPAGDHWSPGSRRSKAGRRPTVARQPRVDAWTCPAVPNFLNFFYFKKMNFWKFGKWARAFGRMGV